MPAEQVRRALGGRVGGLSLTLEKSDPGKANLLVKANLVDPKLQVAGVVVRAAPLSAVGKLSPNSDGSWPALPDTQPVELRAQPPRSRRRAGTSRSRSPAPATPAARS